MKHYFRVYKHYSIGSFYDLAAAHKRKDEISERFPDRDYVITTNGRSGYTKYKVEQVKQFDLAVELPPEPRQEHYARHSDYLAARDLWREERDRYLEDMHAALRKPMNP